jgi:tetratricopeptide (TPR) repeat protein
MKKYNIQVLLLTGIMGLLLIGCASKELTSAKVYIQHEDWENAEIYLVKALEVEPENPEIPFLLGNVIYGRQGKWIEMNDMFSRALRIDPNKKILQGGTVQQYINQSREQFWADMYNKGVIAFNNYKRSPVEGVSQDLTAAMEAFNTAAEIRPDEPQSYSILATCYFELGNNDVALDMIMKSVKLDPENFNSNLTAGQLLSSNEDLEGAVQYLSKAVELEPTNSMAVRFLAQTYYDLDRLEDAEQVYSNALESEQDIKAKADLYFNLGVLHLQMEDLTGAEDYFMMAYDLNPEDVEALRGIAQTFENAEKWRRAERFYKELIELEPEIAEHYRGMARVLIRQGKPDEAQKYFEESKRY